MKNISEFHFIFQVSVEDIDAMFSYADQDCDGKINWTEFQTMINPPKPSEPPKLTRADLAVALAVKINTEKPQTLSVRKIMSENNSVSSIFPEATWGSVIRGSPM